MRITGLAKGVFYSTVVIDGPAGRGEVDACYPCATADIAEEVRKQRQQS